MLLVEEHDEQLFLTKIFNIFLIMLFVTCALSVTESIFQDKD